MPDNCARQLCRPWNRTTEPDNGAGHRGSRHPPQGPAWPWGNYLLDFLSPLRRLCPHLRLPDEGGTPLYTTEGLPPYAGQWPALSGHTVLTSEHSDTYPVPGFITQSSYTFEYIDKSTLQHIYKCHNQYNIHNSGNSQYI